MKPIFAVLGCAGLSLVLAGPTYAQTTTTANNGTAPVSTTTPTTTTAGPNGSLEKYHDKFRASKLVGSNVYNESGQTIGSIDDLMIDNDGKIADAVVSVGGFLGIGGKLVSVPFDQFKFVESRKSVANADTTVAPVNPAAAPPAATADTARVATNSNTNSNSSSPIYYSIVLPSATKDSLSSAAGFKYTS